MTPRKGFKPLRASQLPGAKFKCGCRGRLTAAENETFHSHSSMRSVKHQCPTHGETYPVEVDAGVFVL